MKAGFVFICVLFLSLSVNSADAQNAKPRMVLLFPARPALVQTAFDAAWLRPVDLVSYDTDHAGNLLMWHWNPAQRQWIDLPAEALRSSLLMREKQADVLVIGDDPQIVTDIQAATVWAESVDTLLDLNKLPVFNRLNKSLQFSPREWRWLAERHGLQLQDVNVSRRRYGRWGPPGQRTEKTRPAILPQIPLEPRRGVSPRSSISVSEPVETIESEEILPVEEPQAAKPEPARQQIVIESPMPDSGPEKGSRRKDAAAYQPIAPETVLADDGEEDIK